MCLGPDRVGCVSGGGVEGGRRGMAEVQKWRNKWKKNWRGAMDNWKRGDGERSSCGPKNSISTSKVDAMSGLQLGIVH